MIESWKKPKEGESWVTDPEQVEALFMERVAEGEIPEELWDLMIEWANMERVLEKPGEEGTRSGAISIFLTFLALPLPDRYEFLADYIENYVRQEREKPRHRAEIENISRRIKEIENELEDT